MAKRWEEIAEETKAIWDNIDDILETIGDRVTAVLSFANGKPICPNRRSRPAFHWFRPDDRIDNLQLWKPDTGVSGKQARPRTTCENRRIAGNVTALGKDTTDLASFGIDASYGTFSHDVGTTITSRLRNSRSCLLGFGPPVNGRV